MAFNPFELFSTSLVAAFIKRGKIILVSQTCRAAFDHYGDPSRINILMTHYSDEGLALVHYKAVKDDPYGAILYLNRPKHHAKLLEMLQPDSKYRVFTSLVKSIEELQARLNKKYKDNICRYIARNTTWRIGGDKKIIPKMQLIFGELYVHMKYGGQTLRVLLTDIERA